MRTLLLLALPFLLAGCLVWDDQGGEVAISPPPSDTLDGDTVVETWRTLLILNNASSDRVCDVRVETDAALEPSLNSAIDRQILVAPETTVSGGDLCTHCLSIEGACEPVGLYTCHPVGDPTTTSREWTWWVRCE